MEGRRCVWWEERVLGLSLMKFWNSENYRTSKFLDCHLHLLYLFKPFLDKAGVKGMQN